MIRESERIEHTDTQQVPSSLVYRQQCRREGKLGCVSQYGHRNSKTNPIRSRHSIPVTEFPDISRFFVTKIIIFPWHLDVRFVQKILRIAVILLRAWLKNANTFNFIGLLFHISNADGGKIVIKKKRNNFMRYLLTGKVLRAWHRILLHITLQNHRVVGRASF